MTLSPIKSTKAYEAVAEQLKRGIFSGDFLPKTKLPSVRQLSEQFDVSQAAVREALTSLQAIGLVVMRQGEGTFVQEVDPAQVAKTVASIPLISHDDWQALLELRKIIETGTVRLAALRRRADQLTAMDLILQEMERDLAVAELGERADWQFHYAIAAASGNPFLLSLMDAISEKIQTSLRVSRQHLYAVQGEPVLLLQQHRAIYEALLAGDGPAAQERILEHLNHVETTLGF